MELLLVNALLMASSRDVETTICENELEIEKQKVITYRIFLFIRV